MICYADKTFCGFYLKCKDGSTCPKAFTEQIRENAWDWWNKGRSETDWDLPPVCTFIDKPDCFISKGISSEFCSKCGEHYALCHCED